MSDKQIQKWGSYDLDAAKTEEEKLGENSGGQFFNFVAGKNRIRFLPPPVGKRTPFLLVQQHYIEVQGGAASFNCPRLMANERCPGCEKADRLKASGNAADFEEAKKYFPKLRVYANIIDRAHPELGPQVVAYGKMIHEKLVKLRTDEDAGGDFTHPETGFDMVVEKTGEKKSTKYEVRPARHSSPLGDFEWIETQHDLSRHANVPSIDEIREKFNPQGTGGRGASGGGGGGRQLPSGGGRGRSADTDAYGDDD